MQKRTKLKSNICIFQIVITVLKTVRNNQFSEVSEFFKLHKVFILYKTLQSQIFSKIQ